MGKWQGVYKYRAYVDNGHIMILMLDGVKVTPYKWMPKYNCYSECLGISVSSFRKGINDDTIIVR